MEKTFLIILSIVIFASCDRKDECESVFPAPPTIAISIVDNEGKSLIGEENTYKPSEIMLSRNGQEIELEFIEFQGNTSIGLNYGSMQSMADYDFRLRANETDILNLTINEYDGDCFNYKRVDSFKLNGEEISSETTSYIIQK
ncbi:hypothetical protein [Aequorivita lipolytica]|uniref:Uncharacterized protein n=1 Tax=Aequorivita lipolytica TaxID=153267 RepID=A0A5C6YPL8_9FLAO|nr:hypothetical protein [Aequorivita lipolytica]TXD69187.1 hypothetical protein ESV24_09110 [Aequorivita lipolytica]SRX51227.1 hypothetical protein AEQU2_01707 [Aequorivita lipolytica]